MQHEIDLPQHEKSGQKTAVRGRNRVNWIRWGYYLGVPMVVAFYAALNNWEIRHAAGTLGSLTFYAAHAFPPWLTTCAMTHLTMRSLRSWKPPWLLILLLGHTASSLIVVPYSNWLTGIYETAMPELGLEHTLTAYFSVDFWAYFLRAGVIWFGINFLFDRFLQLPLYRYEVPRGYDELSSPMVATEPEKKPVEAGWNANMPAFVTRLPKMLQPEEILFVKAEQHYIKVVTPEKNYMVLYRFSDAVNEINSQLGQQVHRSYWVNTGAIKAVNAKAKDFFVVMRNDEQVPVSGPYQGLVRELARTAELPLKN